MKKVILFFWIAAFWAVSCGWAQSDRPGNDRGAKDDQDQKDVTKEKPKVEKPSHSAPVHPAAGRSAVGQAAPARPQAAPRPAGPAREKAESRPLSPGLVHPSQGQGVVPRTLPGRNEGMPASSSVQDRATGRPVLSSPGESRPAPAESQGLKPQLRPQRPVVGQAPVHVGPAQGRPQAVPEKFKRLGVTRLPDPITDRKILPDNRRERSVVGLPPKDDQGRVFKGSPITRDQMGKAEVRKHMDFVHDALFTGQVRLANDREREVNRYYWHKWNGRSYCHYYDRWGAHWYGWTFGSRFFWTRYDADRWWWYDPDYSRWCYWHNGFWWWQDPYHVNVVHIYVNGNYESAETERVLQPVDAPADLRSFHSPDGTREVKIYGAAGDAFLYDATVPHSFDPVYLASGVKEVRFSGSVEGRPLQILLVLQDESFSLYDGFGNPYSGIEE